MKRLIPIRILMLVIVITVAVFVVAATRATPHVEPTEECIQNEQEGCEKKTQSEFLLESLTRNLMGR
ncbi:MAG: hypothetical protein WCF67_13900 [Chitinophagaceae bacterium]